MRLFPFRKRLLPKTDNHVRVATFNVHFAKRPLAIAHAIAENPHLRDADVFVLQEVEHHEREGQTRAHTFAQALGCEAVYVPARNVSSTGTHGLAIISRFPILESQVISIPQFNLQFRSRQRIAVYSRLQLPDIHLGVYNIHLDTRLNIEDRIEQLKGVIADASVRGDVFTLFAGDFNTLPIVWLKRILPLFYQNQKKHISQFMRTHKFTEAGSRGATMRQGLIRFKLDAIYARGLPVIQWNIEKSISVSDHKPLWADFELPKIKQV